MRRSRKSKRTTSPHHQTLKALYRVEEASIITGEMIELALTKAKRGAYDYWSDEREAMEAYQSVQVEAREAKRLIEALLDLMPIASDEGEVLL